MAACACLRVSTFPALRVPAFTRAEYRVGGRRRDHGATTGRAILPVRAAGRGWRRDRGTTWKWLDMTEEEITEIPKYNASSDILSSIHRRRCSKSRPEAGSQPHKKARSAATRSVSWKPSENSTPTSERCAKPTLRRTFAGPTGKNTACQCST